MKSSFVGLAIALLLAALLVAAFVLSEPPESRWHDLLVLPLILCCVCLLSLFALYLGLGISPLWHRLLTLPLGGAVLWLTDRSGGVRQLVGYSLVVLFMALPSMAMRVVGFRIARGIPDQRHHAGEVRPIQFSLRQLFGLTFVVALAALVVRFWLDTVPDPTHDSFGAAVGKDILRALIIVVSALAIAAPLAVTIALADRTGPWRFFARFVLFTLCMTVVVIAALMSESDMRPFDMLAAVSVAAWIGLHLMATAGALLLVRRKGYRLVRLRSTSALHGQPATANS